MLVLSRQRDETVMIGDSIEVTVVDIRGDKVRLGINAPRDVSVHRKEVYEAIRRENQNAAQVKPPEQRGSIDQLEDYARGRAVDRPVEQGERLLDFAEIQVIEREMPPVMHREEAVLR